MKLDKTDCAILHALQLDGRLSNVNLAAQVNLSESAYLRRVRLLEQAGVVGVVALRRRSSFGSSAGSAMARTVSANLALTSRT